MSYKKFSLILISLVAVLFVSNILLWQCVTRNVFFEDDQGHGDLRRLASYYIPDSRTRPRDYTAKHVEFSEYVDYLKSKGVNPLDVPSIAVLQSNQYEHFDVVTIGDSFFNGGGSNYYQDYLVQEHGLKILNIPKNYLPDGNALSMLYVLLRDGYLSQWQPKAVIIGAAEHYANGRYGEGMVETPAEHLVIRLDDTGSGDGYLNEVYSAEEQLAPPLMVRSNVELLKNKLYYLINGDDLKFSPAVARQMLRQDFFDYEDSHGDQRSMLYFSREDLTYLGEPPNTDMINRNFNNAAGKLHNVLPDCKLVFAPSADKLDVYFPYLATSDEIAAMEKSGSSDLENPFFLRLNRADKKYIFVDTREIMRGLLSEGQQDVYWNDDTHYSFKAHEAIADAIYRSIF